MRATIVLVMLVGASCAAWAEGAGPVIAIPGHRGVPVIINGVDASYALVEGEWGLGMNSHVEPTVYGGRPYDPELPPIGHYYPSSGRLPGYGRLEIEPPGKPRPAESFHQSWSTESKSQPEPQQQGIPPIPFYPPPVINAPQYRDGDENSLHAPQQSKGTPPRTNQP